MCGAREFGDKEIVWEMGWYTGGGFWVDINQPPELFTCCSYSSNSIRLQLAIKNS